MLKRPNDGGDGKRKKAKQVLAKRQPKSAKAFPIVPGMGGILVSCTLNKEKFATKEVMSLLTEMRCLGKKNGRKKKDDAMQESDDDEEEETIEDAFKKELEGLKSTSKLKRFPLVESPIVPVDFTLKILNDLFETKKKKTSSRCRDLHWQHWKALSNLQTRCFLSISKEDKPVKYSIVFNRRNSDRVSREEVIPELDIKNPDIVILVEFNLESIHDEEHAKRAFKLEKTGGSAGTERRKAKANHKREQEERAKNKGWGARNLRKAMKRTRKERRRRKTNEGGKRLLACKSRRIDQLQKQIIVDI
ncbi:hypothetical protein BC829DRAFT_415749 [Chytridium lagenaria]|nr:hypothetical protein BC829DRAFT_415749 [Chytridium lagenaria]